MHAFTFATRRANVHASPTMAFPARLGTDRSATRGLVAPMVRRGVVEPGGALCTRHGEGLAAIGGSQRYPCHASCLLQETRPRENCPRLLRSNVLGLSIGDSYSLFLCLAAAKLSWSHTQPLGPPRALHKVLPIVFIPEVGGVAVSPLLWTGRCLLGCTLARDLKLKTQFPSPLQLKIPCQSAVACSEALRHPAGLLAPSLTKYSTAESTHHLASRLAAVAPAKTWVLHEDGRRENTPSHRALGHQPWCRLPML